MHYVQQWDVGMYLLDHLNETSELLVHGGLLFLGGKWEELVSKVFRGLSSSGSLESSCFGDSSSSTCGLAAFYAWLGSGGSRVDLPPLVVTAFIFSKKGIAAAICSS